MNLFFQQTWPKHIGKWVGKPTYFVEKIWERLQHEIKSEEDFNHWFGEVDSAGHYDALPFKVNPKLHTIRSGNRWKVGDKIHMKIWTRRPYHSKTFQFAPVLEVRRVQDIEVWRSPNYMMSAVLVDGRHLTMREIRQLATNDGFDSVEQFFTYFNKPFEGQIISWVEWVEY